MTARKERVATIRKDYWKKFWLGVGLITGAAAIFAICWYGFGFVVGKVTSVCVALGGFGAWKLIDGLAGVLMAANKQGPLEDEY